MPRLRRVLARLAAAAEEVRWDADERLRAFTRDRPTAALALGVAAGAVATAVLVRMIAGEESRDG